MNKAILEKYKPWATRRRLLILAALTWTFAGGMLLYKSLQLFLEVQVFPLWSFVIGLAGGILFYVLLFARISLKHSKRILEMENDRRCFFSFFSYRSYLVMIGMIGMSISLKHFGLIPPEYMMLVDLVMGIPLFLSSFRFYSLGFAKRG